MPTITFRPHVADTITSYSHTTHTPHHIILYTIWCLLLLLDAMQPTLSHHTRTPHHIVHHLVSTITFRCHAADTITSHHTLSGCRHLHVDHYLRRDLSTQSAPCSTVLIHLVYRPHSILTEPTFKLDRYAANMSWFLSAIKPRNFRLCHFSFAIFMAVRSDRHLNLDRYDVV